jgi:hypothetical protein
VSDLEYIYWPLTYETFDEDVSTIISLAMCVSECPTETNSFECKVISDYDGKIDPTTCRFNDDYDEIYYNTKTCKFRSPFILF